MTTDRTVLTFGTYDLFHIGHLRLLERARSFGDRLVVGVSTDQMSFEKKARFPIIPQEERREIVGSLRWVTGTFYEHRMEDKRRYLEEHGADVLVMGDDWRGRFDEFQDIVDVKYVARTETVSTTWLEAYIKQRDGLTKRGSVA